MSHEGPRDRGHGSCQPGAQASGWGMGEPLKASGGTVFGIRVGRIHRLRCQWGREWHPGISLFPNTGDKKKILEVSKRGNRLPHPGANVRMTSASPQRLWSQSGAASTEPEPRPVVRPPSKGEPEGAGAQAPGRTCWEEYPAGRGRTLHQGDPSPCPCRWERGIPLSEPLGPKEKGPGPHGLGVTHTAS